MAKTSLFFMAGAAMAMSSHASAQQFSYDPREVMGFSLEELTELATDNGWKSQLVDDGNSQVLGVEISGRRLVLWPRACDTTGANCGGLYVFALIPEQSSTSATNAFNVKFNPGRATIRDGQVVLDHYIVGDFGVTKGSLSIDLQVQASLIEAWWKFRSTHAVSAQVAFDPLFDDEDDAAHRRRDENHLDGLTLSPEILDQLGSGNGATSN